jgi:hypothetical protein
MSHSCGTVFSYLYWGILFPVKYLSRVSPAKSEGGTSFCFSDVRKKMALLFLAKQVLITEETRLQRLEMGTLSDHTKYREAIFLFEKQIDRMHVEFDKFRRGETNRMPDWERLERDLLFFSRRKPSPLELSNQLDRILYKFQARKRVWLRWAESFHHSR